jgi:hypothetical protein
MLLNSMALISGAIPGLLCQTILLCFSFSMAKKASY